MEDLTNSTNQLECTEEHSSAHHSKKKSMSDNALANSRELNICAMAEFERSIEDLIGKETPQYNITKQAKENIDPTNIMDKINALQENKQHYRGPSFGVDFQPKKENTAFVSNSDFMTKALYNALESKMEVLSENNRLLNDSLVQLLLERENRVNQQA